MADESDRRPEPESLSPVEGSEQSPSQSDARQDTGTDLPIPEEVLADVPEEHRRAIVRAFGSVTQFAAPVFNPIFQRVTSEHVSRIIDNTENESVREHDASASRRRYQFAYFLLGAVVTVGLIVFFTVSDNRDLIAPVVTGALGFLGGLAAGQRFRS